MIKKYIYVKEDTQYFQRCIEDTHSDEYAFIFKHSGRKASALIQTEVSAAYSDDFALCMIKIHKLGGETGKHARPVAAE